VFSALANLLFLAPTIYMLQVYDRVVPTRGDLTLGFLTLVLLFALATLSLLEFVRSRILVRASIRLDRELAETLIAATLATTRRSTDRSRQPIRECDQLRQALTGPAIFALFDAPWMLIYIFVCALIHPAIGVLALVGALAILFIAWRSDRTTREPLLHANTAANLSYASQEQSVLSAEAIRALGMTGAMVRRHLAEREDMLSLQATASFAASRQMALSRFLRNALQSCALGLGALLAIDGQISGGAIFASSFLLGRAISPVDQIVASWRNIIQARASYAEITAWLTEYRPDAPSIQLPCPTGRIDVEQVDVFDRRGDRALLSKLSFTVEPGEMVAITGPSGAGKSTLARVIAGAIPCDAGVIRIDGAERTHWDGDALAAHIGYLPQQVSLLGGTIRDNISRFVDPRGDDALDKAVIAAAMDCGVHDMILRFPDGYDTMLGWGGAGLSMGQSQRIALARALFREPSILILDEPNAHLDAEGETHLVRALIRAKERGAAVLVTAHRAGVLAPADRILVLNNGRMQALGPRDEIMGALGRQAPPAPRGVVVAGGRG
jgi:ATP-binding cassette subfamily C protein